MNPKKKTYASVRNTELKTRTRATNAGFTGGIPWESLGFGDILSSIH